MFELTAPQHIMGHCVSIVTCMVRLFSRSFRGVDLDITFFLCVHVTAFTLPQSMSHDGKFLLTADRDEQVILNTSFATIVSQQKLELDTLPSSAFFTISINSHFGNHLFDLKLLRRSASATSPTLF